MAEPGEVTVTDTRPAPSPDQADKTRQPMAGQLTESVVVGAAWRFGALATTGLLQFVVSVVLARLIAPRDFGLVAFSMIFIGFLNLVSSLGVGPALIQREELSPRTVRVAVTLAAVAGLVCVAVLWVLAAYYGSILHQPALPAVLRVLSLSFLLEAMAAIPYALLRRGLQFKTLFMIDTVAYCAGYVLVGITLAALGMGVWALVAASLVQSAATLVLAYVLVRHPVRPCFDWKVARTLAGFGGTVSASAMVNYIATTGDNFTAGRLLGPTALGLYGKGYSLMTLPLTYGAQMLASVLFPAYAKRQKDGKALGVGYLSSTSVVTVFAAPVMAMLVVTAPELVRTLFGARWDGTIAPLRVLALFGVFRAVYHLAGPIAQATGNVRRELVRQILYAVCVLVFCAVGTHWGIVGVAFGAGLAITIMYLAMSGLALSLTGVSWPAYLYCQAPGVAVGLAVAGVGFLTKGGLYDAGLSDAGVLACVLAVMSAFGVLTLRILPTRWRPIGLDRATAVLAARLPARAAKVVSVLLP